MAEAAILCQALCQVLYTYDFIYSLQSTFKYNSYFEAALCPIRKLVIQSFMDIGGESRYPTANPQQQILVLLQKHTPKYTHFPLLSPLCFPGFKTHTVDRKEKASRNAETYVLTSLCCQDFLGTKKRNQRPKLREPSSTAGSHTVLKRSPVSPTWPPSFHCLVCFSFFPLLRPAHFLYSLLTHSAFMWSFSLWLGFLKNKFYRNPAMLHFPEQVRSNVQKSK